MNLKEKIRVIENFPKEGISFKDITTLLQDGEAFSEATKQMTTKIAGVDFDLIVSPESRGFIFGTPMAVQMKKGFCMVRKKGKLPSETIESKYDLEYSNDILQLHKDAVAPGQKVIIVDDLLATGGTIQTVIKLVETLGGKVE